MPGLPGTTLPAESPPTWGTTLLDAVQKSSRAQARLSLRVEDLERKLEGGLAELRGSLSSLRGATSGNSSSGSEPPWDDLLDALDLLEEASRVAADEALASGLMGVAARLERFVTASGLTRLASIGHIPDGRLFRIVGTQPHPSFAEGAIARVVRAAALRGERLIREGEAIIVRNTP
ncbi:nucleotide exchange factor GrpE [Archangium lansingense]|uniref:nucleotide exchange factor GrpE n=1 Tax=Archangium lansingense TaxID=2995310 RepID=UPI003B7CF248